MYSRIVAAALAASATEAASGVYNYNSLGADWSEVNELCGTGKEQSPIDLVKWNTNRHPDQKIEGFNYRNYGPEAGLGIIKETDTFKMAFTDGRLNVTLPPTGEEETATRSNFYPIQLHFHAPSEHTVNGMHFDLEMHIVHTY